jgi:hypothetical protein
VWEGEKKGKRKWKKNVLHPSRAASPVTVMEVHALAGQNEGADAILQKEEEEKKKKEKRKS